MTDLAALLKRCTVIYAPAGNAGEYSELAANPYTGCGHECLYCYVPLAMHMKRDVFNAGANVRPGFLCRLQDDAEQFQRAGVPAQIFLTFSSDPYHLDDTQPTRWALEILRDHGLGFCTLTKGGLRALADIDLFRPDRDAFACTLTSLSDTFSRKWERRAAPPAERIAALRAFHGRGIFTWVSLEPTLNVESSLAIIDATAPFVDLYKVGRANYLKEITETTDWAAYTQRVIAKLQRLGKAHYIKKDLQPYLPAGYHNPLRVPQHNGARAAA